MRRKKLSEKHKRKISEANKNPSERTRRKMSEAKKGIKISEVTRYKMSEDKKGEKNPSYKEIIATSPNGITYKGGINSLVLELKISNHTISKLLKGGTSKKHAGWTFKYTNNEQNRNNRID